MAKVKGSVKSNKKPFAKGASVRKAYTTGRGGDPFSMGTQPGVNKRKRPVKKAAKKTPAKKSPIKKTTKKK